MDAADLASRRVGFIGGGAMAEALLRGLLRQIPAANLLAADIMPARRDWLHNELGIAVTADNRQVCRQSDIVVLAVKPQVFEPVLKGIREDLTSRNLLISIVAGVPLNRLEALLLPGVPVVRVMPNTPALIGLGASALAGGSNAEEDHLVMARAVLAAAGVAEVVSESYLDAVTGLSGSGPAYVYLFIEAMIDAGVREGLPRDLARKLTLQTVLGAAEMVRQSGNHPAVERDKVTSPGGTTIAGVEALEAGGLRAACYAAVRAATRRSRELGGSK